MTIPQEIVAAYDALVKKARKIATAAPYWGGGPYGDDGAWLEIDGDKARLRYLECHSGYEDSCDMEVRHSNEFPVGLLSLPDADLDSWLTEKQEQFERERAEEVAREEAKRARLNEARERQALAFLKAKYEGKP